MGTQPSQVTLGHSPPVSGALLRVISCNSEHGAEAPATLTSLDTAVTVPAQNSIYHETQNSSLGATCIVSALWQLCPVCVGRAHVWRQLKELSLSFCYVDPRMWTQVIKRGSDCLQMLSLLHSPQTGFSSTSCMNKKFK